MKVEGKPTPLDVVVKGNALVHASYTMERREKMLMWFLIWAYQKERSSQLTLSCTDIGDFIGMNRDGVYNEIWNVARGLRARELLLHNAEEDSVTACGFVNWVKYGARRSGEIDFQITDRIVPHIERFIEDMKIGFTKFEMGVIASLRSFYSLRLYEICKSMNFGEFRKEGWEITFEDLRKRFGVYVVDAKGKVQIDSYGAWYRFREKVLDKAVKEVNEASDLKVTYKLRKQGREVVAVRFWATANKAGAVVMESEPRDHDLMQRMSRLGVSGRMMTKLFDKYGKTDRGRLEYALRQAEMAIKAGKVKKSAAWFVAAVERDDRAQGELFSPEKRAQEKKLEVAELAREAELRKRKPDAPSGPPKAIGELLSSDMDPKLKAVLEKMAGGVASRRGA